MNGKNRRQSDNLETEAEKPPEEKKTEELLGEISPSFQKKEEEKTPEGKGESLLEIAGKENLEPEKTSFQEIRPEMPKEEQPVEEVKPGEIKAVKEPEIPPEEKMSEPEPGGLPPEEMQKRTQEILVRLRKIEKENKDRESIAAGALEAMIGQH